MIKFKCTFTDTKNGKDRTVPISEDIHAMITEGDARQLFPDVNYNTVRNLLKALFPDLPDGQATHVMRHSFASHFMMNGRNILTLQKILGHAAINQTIVYAHFAPDYLNDAARLNPLNNNLQRDFMSQVEKVNIIKIYCDKTCKEEISALFTKSDFEVGVIHCFSENAPDLLVISFKIGSMAVERLKKVLTMFVKKTKKCISQWLTRMAPASRSQNLNKRLC